MNTSAINHRPITYRQLRAVDFWFRNGRKSKARALREAGYKNSITRQPHKVFDSPAVRRELEKRGHGTSGMLDNQPQTIEVMEKTPTTPAFDISKITEDQLQQLREQLATIPDPPQKPSYSPTVSGISYAQKSAVKSNNHDPFSIM